jgi:cytochrome c peroxidase
VQVDMTAGLPNGLKGDFKRGGAFYLANCATCHGARGDGAGPRAYFINPKPRNFVEPASRARFNRLALYAAVSEGRNWQRDAGLEAGGHAAADGRRVRVRVPELHPAAPAAQATAARP